MLYENCFSEPFNDLRDSNLELWMNFLSYVIGEFFFLSKMRGGGSGLRLENRQGIVVSDTSLVKGLLKELRASCNI